MRRKNNYVVRGLDTPKKVTLPNGWTFYAKYQRVPRSQLPPNAIMKRRYRIRTAPKGRKRRPKRKGQRGWGFLSYLTKNSKKSTCKTNRKKTALKKAVDYAPQLNNLGTSKRKNKTARKILQSGAPTILLNNHVTKDSRK